MNNLITINNTEILIKEYKGQRVITLKEIDSVHERAEGTAKRNFNSNKVHFIEEIDYFFVKPIDVETYEIRTSEINNSGTYLITESGYLMLVKSLTDDLAWKVQRDLVKGYFRATELQSKMQELSPELRLLINMELEQKKIHKEIKETQKEVAATKQEIQDVRDVVSIVPGENWRKDTNYLLNKVCKKLGDYKTPKDKLYKALEDRGKCKLKTRLGNLRQRALSNGMAGSKVDALNYLDVLEDDVRLKEIYIAIVKEMAIKNGIDIKQ